jgi:hypothetical protein
MSNIISIFINRARVSSTHYARRIVCLKTASRISYLRTDFAALTGSTVSRRRQINRLDRAGLGRESRQMQDSWQGQTSRLSSSAAHTLLQPPLRFCCLLLLTAPISLPFFLPPCVSFSLALAKNHRICAHEETWERIRGRGRLRRLSW